MNEVRAIDIRLLGKKRTGDEAVFFNLTKELLKLDTEHQYLLLTDEDDQTKLAVIQGKLGCIGQKNVHFVTLSGKNRFLWNLITLPWFLYCTRVDILHTQYILPFWVPKRTKVALHIHDVSFAVYPELISWKDRLFLSLLIPRSLRRATAILTPSQFTKDEIVRHYHIASQKITVIPNAVSEEFAQKETGDGNRVKEKYRLPERFMVYVGTLQPRKNIPFLLKAFAEVRKQIPDIHLVLVGNRSAHHFDENIDREIQAHDLDGLVHFPGYVDQSDLPLLIGLAEVFTFPTLYEGFGIPVLEAMSQGVPVALSDIPCLREIAGEAAFYFDPTSVASCEKVLYTLLTDKEQRESGIAKGQHRISLFSWKKSANLLLEEYHRL
jgi:glycosyltransferase involved in cell wall biosynthesis